MNRKRAFAVITVLLVALVSTSPIVAEETQAVEKLASFMFVQSAHTGSFAPVTGEDNLYTLTLNDIAPQTIYFSDRPERIVGQAPMQEFLDGLCFSQDSPPNGAIVILEADEGMDVVVVELFDPAYDAASRTLQYTASILETPNHSYAIFNEQHDGAIPETFGAVSLFIDDCADAYWKCCNDAGKLCGKIKVGKCYNWIHFRCDWCTEDHGRDCARSYDEKCIYSCQ